MATKTLQNMRDIFYAILKENEDTSAYPLTLADVLINSAQNNICSWNITDLNTSNKAKIEKWPLPFLYSDKFYTTVQDNYLSAATTIWATTLSITDSSWFASTWSVWIDWNIITYTWNTWTWFTWVTGVLFAHKSWARVTQIFSLPTDYATTNRVIYNSQIALKNRDYRDIYMQLNNFKGNVWANNNVSTTLNRFTQDIPPFYSIVKQDYFLPFQLNNSWYAIHQIYEKTPTAMTAWTDLCTIPDAYSEQTIPFIAVADILWHRGEEARALELNKFWVGKVLSMYDYYANFNNESLHNQRIECGSADAYLNI